MVKGVVYKAYGGYYFVDTGRGRYQCYLRGRLNLKKERILVGDTVQLTFKDNDTGVIESREPRRTKLFRPPVANVDIVVIVFSLTDPDPNLLLLDRFLIQAEAAQVSPVICFNKKDLTGEEEYSGMYRKVNYPVIVTSTFTNEGTGELGSMLEGKITVFAGPSGSGKSSLLNVIQPGLSLKTGEISSKLRKGKHTTRHVELLSLDSGAMVADTPGFSNVFLPPELTSDKLWSYFPDFIEYVEGCRFSSCLHYKEPDCGVKKAVKEDEIVHSRYKNYVIFLEELLKQERR